MNKNQIQKYKKTYFKTFFKKSDAISSMLIFTINCSVTFTNFPPAVGGLAATRPKMAEVTSPSGHLNELARVCVHKKATALSVAALFANEQTLKNKILRLDRF